MILKLQSIKIEIDGRTLGYAAFVPVHEIIQFCCSNDSFRTVLSCGSVVVSSFLENKVFALVKRRGTKRVNPRNFEIYY